MRIQIHFQKMSAFVFALAFVLSPAVVSAQNRTKGALHPPSYGIIGGYHFRNGADFGEIGITRYDKVHSLFAANALSFEFGKTGSGEPLYAFTTSAWISFVASLGLTAAYFTDFRHANAFVIRPMIGLGIMGVQIVYSYDLNILKSDFEFGSRHRLALRVNLGILDHSYPKLSDEGKF